MRSELAVGDVITTIGGIVGTICAVKEETIVIEPAPTVCASSSPSGLSPPRASRRTLPRNNGSKDSCLFRRRESFFISGPA